MTAALIILVVVSVTAIVILEVVRFRLCIQPLKFIEVSPPSGTNRMTDANEQLMVSLHGLLSSQPLLGRLLGVRPRASFEITATKADGIRYVIGARADELAAFKQTLSAFLPDVKFKEVSIDNPIEAKIVSFRQAKHYALPLKPHTDLEAHDPQSFITGAMAQLGADGKITVQLVLQPASIRGVKKLSQGLLNNEDVLYQIQGSRVSPPRRLFKIINGLLFMVLDVFRSAAYGGMSSPSPESRHQFEQLQVAKRVKPARSLSSLEQEIATTIHYKLGQPLFVAALRVSVTTNSKKETSSRLRAMRSALAQFNVPKYQQLKPYRLRYGKPGRLYHRYLYMKRLPSLRFTRPMVLSASEAATIYHLPHNESAKTENIQKSLSRSLPAPVSLKNGTKLDVYLGENNHHGSITPVGLTEAERQRHVYVIGGTGNGKTTMLQYSIVQDMQNGKGVVVIDPHGDLAETLLCYVPEERVSDVVYFNPDDFGYPIGLNLLELPEDISGDDLLREKDLVTESTISVMRKMFSEDDSGGHRIEYILRNTIQTALTLEDPTLFTIFKLLNDTKFRRDAIKTLEDTDLKNFWKNELGKAGDMQRVKMVAGITAKIGRFLFSASAKRILEQPKSTIDFDEIFDQGKILICNFSKGLLGEDTSTLFGTTILAKLQMTALRRARQKQASRKPVYLYVDEFQNFATMSFVQMLSEARKYKLFLTMAEQSTSQQDKQRLVDIILANVGTVICFRSGSPSDERYLLPLFAPYIQPGEIAYLPAYNFYCRINAVASQEPMSGQTVLLLGEGSREVAARVVESSRQLHGYVKEVTTEDEVDKPKPKSKRQKAILGKPI